MKKIGGFGYLIEIWRNQLKCKIMDVFEAPIELIVTGNDVLSQMYNEDKLIIQMMDLDANQGHEHIHLCNTHLYFDLPTVKQALLPLAAKIPEDALIHFYTKSLDLLKGASIRYITGMQIHFGFVGNTLQLIYQPLLMKWNRFDPITLDDLYVIDREKDTNYDIVYYTFNGTDFVSVTKLVAEGYISDYQRLIRIKHNSDTGEVFKVFSNGDVSSIILPFQTIFSILTRENSDNLFLHNSIRKLKENPSNNIKHCLLMSTKPVTLGNNSGRQFSNRSHLCPPCQNEIGFDIAE